VRCTGGHRNLYRFRPFLTHFFTKKTQK
jgi:hypothetical protein